MDCGIYQPTKDELPHPVTGVKLPLKGAWSRDGDPLSKFGTPSYVPIYEDKHVKFSTVSTLPQGPVVNLGLPGTAHLRTKLKVSVFAHSTDKGPQFKNWVTVT